uniref:Uncharacterized protein n=1 Tax=Oryza rufipogon TaxID=4529 RepID=A0A0E0Q552_ORYRU
MHPQALQILRGIEGDMSGFRFCFAHMFCISIGGISSTTNIDSGSDKYPYIVVRSTSARPGNAGSFTSQSLAVTSKQYTSCSLLLQSCYAAAS